MLSVKGLYENGQVRLLEEVERQDPCQVIVTFLEDTEDEAMRRKRIEEIMSFAGIWSDLSEEEEQVIEEILASRKDTSFAREIDL